MIRLVEGLAALTLAAGVHLAAFAVFPIPVTEGDQGEDARGKAQIQAAQPQLAALVTRWSEAPDVVSAAPQPVRPEAQVDLPDTQQPMAPTRHRPDQISPARDPAVLPDITTPIPMRVPAPSDMAGLSAPVVMPSPTVLARPTAPDRPNLASRPDLLTPLARTALDIDTASAARPGPSSLRPVLRPREFAAKATPRSSRVISKPVQTARKSAAAAAPKRAQTRAKAGGLTKAQQTALRNDWGAGILAKVKRNIRAQSGQAQRPGTLAITVRRDGRLAGVSLRRSSGNARLDKAALSAVKRAGRFRPAPTGLGQASYTFALRFR